MITVNSKSIDGYTQLDINSSDGVIEIDRLSDDEKMDVAAEFIRAASELLRDEYINYSNQLDEIVEELT